MAHLKIRCTEDGYVLLPGEDYDNCPICGEQNWEYLCEARGELFRGDGCPWCAYVFQGEEFQDSATLAAAFLRHWDTAVRATHENPLSRWARSLLSGAALADKMSRLDADFHLEPQQRLSLTVALLDPSLPLIWEGSKCDEALIAENPNLGLAILESQLPQHCRVFGIHEWLPGLDERWRNAIQKFSSCSPPSVPRPSPAGVLSFVLGNPSALGMTEVLPLVLAETCQAASELSSLLKHRSRRMVAVPRNPPPVIVSPSATIVAKPITSAKNRLESVLKSPSVEVSSSGSANKCGRLDLHPGDAVTPDIPRDIVKNASDNKPLVARAARLMMHCVRQAKVKLRSLLKVR